jgi:phage-related minor tail protein
MTIKDPTKHDYQRRAVEAQAANTQLKRELEQARTSIANLDEQLQDLVKYKHVIAPNARLIHKMTRMNERLREQLTVLKATGRFCKAPEEACTCLHVGNEYEGGC